MAGNRVRLSGAIVRHLLLSGLLCSFLHWLLGSLLRYGLLCGFLGWLLSCRLLGGLLNDFLCCLLCCWLLGNGLLSCGFLGLGGGGLLSLDELEGSGGTDTLNLLKGTSSYTTLEGQLELHGCGLLIHLVV